MVCPELLLCTDCHRSSFYPSGLVVSKLEDYTDEKAVSKILQSIVAAKQFGYEDLLSPVIAKACIQVLPKNLLHFSTESVRVAKTLGGGITDTKLIKGFVLLKAPEGTIHRVDKAKVAVFAIGIESSKTEAKGVVVLDTPEALAEFSKGEEKQIEEVSMII